MEGKRRGKEEWVISWNRYSQLDWKGKKVKMITCQAQIKKHVVTGESPALFYADFFFSWWCCCCQGKATTTSKGEKRAVGKTKKRVDKGQNKDHLEPRCDPHSAPPPTPHSSSLPYVLRFPSPPFNLVSCRFSKTAS